MRKAIIGLILGVGLIGWLGTSCSNTDCVITNTSYTNYGFYNERGQAVSLSGTISVTAAGTDSVLINQEANPKQFQLPLSYTHTEDTFIVHYTEKIVDSIFVKHANIPHFISMDCGTGMYHFLEGVRSTNNAIDSIQIINPEVTYDAKENIKIYYTAGV